MNVSSIRIKRNSLFLDFFLINILYIFSLNKYKNLMFSKIFLEIKKNRERYSQNQMFKIDAIFVVVIGI